MDMLFNGSCPEKMKEPLQGMRTSSDARIRAIGDNFAFEPNVCGRRKSFWVGSYESGADLKQHIKEFWTREVAEAIEPDFLDSAYDRKFVYGPGEPPKVPALMLIATCLDLTRLHRVLVLAARKFKIAYFIDPENPYPHYAAKETDQIVWEWHSKLCAPGPEAAKRHTYQIIAALNKQIEDGHPRNPVWTTNWFLFAKEARHSAPDGWLNLLGIERHEWNRSRWLAMITYPVRHAEALLLPTAIDAGEFSTFYPSPPGSGTGHPMRLDKAGSYLHVEFIHKQIPYSSRATVEWVGHTEGRTDPDNAEYEAWRAAHRQELLKVYEERKAEDAVRWLSSMTPMG